MSISAPGRLADDHDLAGFYCSQPSLTRWLQEKIRPNQRAGASNCFVVCDEARSGKAVVGYYALAAGSIERAGAPGTVRRNMPDPIPVAILGRLAVHDDYRGQGIGAGLLRDAAARCLRVAEEGLGIRALLCHAIDGSAKAFYVHHGFVQSPIEEMTVMLNLADLVRRSART